MLTRRSSVLRMASRPIPDSLRCPLSVTLPIDNACVDNYLAARGTLLDCCVGLANVFKREAPRIDTRCHLPSFYQSGSLAKNVAVVCPTFASQQRQQREYARIGCRSKRQR